MCGVSRIRTKRLEAEDNPKKVLRPEIRSRIRERTASYGAKEAAANA